MPSRECRSSHRGSESQGTGRHRWRWAGLAPGVWAEGLAAGLCAGLLLLLCSGGVRAQESATLPVAPSETLTVKRAVELALRNSRELAAARLQQDVAEKSALVANAEFRPNLYAGSGAGYTNGIPETPGGRAPSIFNISYTQQIFNSPLKGQVRELQERAGARAIRVDEVRDAVIVQTVSEYLELAKVRHSLGLLRAGQKSAERILEVTNERFSEGLELSLEVTRARLEVAKVARRILELEGREDSLATSLRGLTGLPQDAPLEVSAEDLPAAAEQPGTDLMGLALANNTDLKQAESERRARELRLKGEAGGRWPTLGMVGTYSVLDRFNNYDEFFKKFQRHNVNVGVQIEIPLFSARTNASIALARTNLKAAEIKVQTQRAELGADVKRQAHRTRELEAAREVARLELQLAQQQLGVLQTQFQEGRTSLRDLEKARLAESDRWMEFLDAEFARQQAQLELLRTTGQLARVFQ
jgi:outer membrane protein TolC